MPGLFRAGLVVVCLMLIFCHSVSAFNVSQLTIDPSGAITPGTPVIVTGTIDFTPSQGGTFDRRHDLQFNTTLEKAKWTWTPSIKGVVTPVTTRQPGIIPLPDPPFHYPENDNAITKFTLLGIAPSVSETTNITILRIQEVDEKGILIPGSSREFFASVVTVADSGPYCESINKTLQEFKSHIEEKSAAGVNTTPAEMKYTEIKAKVDAGQALRSNCDADASNVSAIYHVIDDGERLLDKAWAEKEVADAEIPLKQTNQIIGWFKGNKSTADDDMLPGIIALNDLAAANISLANNEIETGNYEHARVSAKTAALLANDSLDKITDRKNYISQGPGCGWCINPFSRFVLPIAGFIAIIICVAGIIWWKKRTQ